MKRLLAPALAVSLTACGALFNGSPANVAFNSTPSGAEIWIDGTARGVTPATLPLAKNKSYAVTFRKAGFGDATATIDRKVSAGYVILDVLGGIIPIVVDAATGSWYTLSTNNVSMNLPASGAVGSSSSRAGQLTPAQLEAVKNGTPVGEFVRL